jgi:hypothetical protein
MSSPAVATTNEAPIAMDESSDNKTSSSSSSSSGEKKTTTGPLTYEQRALAVCMALAIGDSLGMNTFLYPFI